MYEGRILKEGIPDGADRGARSAAKSSRSGSRPTRTQSSSRARRRVPAATSASGDTLYFYCRDGHDIGSKLAELDLPNTVHRPATLEDVFLKLTGRSLIE